MNLIIRRLHFKHSIKHFLKAILSNLKDVESNTEIEEMGHLEGVGFCGGRRIDGWLISSVGPVASRMGHKDNPDNAELESLSLPTSSQHTGFIFLFEALLCCGFLIQIIDEMKGSK